MHVRRDLLFAGLFFIPVGAITLLVRAGTINADALLDAPRLWPLILVGIGIAILLGRGRAASLGTAVVALVLGVLVGSAIASGNVWIGAATECDPFSGSGATQHLDRTGTFDGPASLDLQIRCGSVALSTKSGNDWALSADYRGPAPSVSGGSDRLQVRVPEGSGVRHHDWTIQAPAGRLGAVQLKSTAATGTLVLAGATLSTVDIESTAGDIEVDGGDATIGRIDVSVNAGRARIQLGGTSTVGDLSVNAGALDVCVPAGASLRLEVNDQLTFLTNLADRGLQKNGTTWTRTGSTAGPLLDLHIEGNAASLTLDPAGGCR